MSKKSASDGKGLAGRFIAWYIHPKTGERIYAKKYGKKVFFIPIKKQGDSTTERKSK